MVNGTVLSGVELTHRSITRADCIALLTPHRSFDLEWISERALLMFDARNALQDLRKENVVRL
jgi:UDP-N-acetyl-D-mannosaminuronate dehydrogenase